MSRRARKGERILKLWQDWSAGIGYLRDDGRTPGMYNADGILGGVNELRAAQFLNDTDFSAQATNTDLIAKYFFDENIGSTASVLYAVMNRGGATGGEIVKISMQNSDFATAITTDTASRNSAAEFGRPARYQDAWYIPDTSLIHKVSGFSVSADDTWATSDGEGGTHLSMLNHQLTESTTGASKGVRILPADLNPLTDSEWASYFDCGDNREAATDLFSIGDLMFVTKRSGLYSFGTKNGVEISGQVFSDFGSWRSGFDHQPTALWKGGAVIPHTTGLLYYTPGEPFTSIGFEAKKSAHGIPAEGVTELKIGRYQSTAIAGDYIYTIYQPDTSSTSAFVLVGHAPGTFPTDIAWQVLGATTLSAIGTDAAHGIHVTALGFPEISTKDHPVLWFTNVATGTSNLGYIILGSRGQPLRTRASTHKIVTSGDAWMSEIFFDEPVDLKRIVVYCDDMSSDNSDEWQLSAVYNGTGKDVKIGKPFISNGRQERPIMRRDIYRIVLHVNFVGTSTSSRVPPSIKRIELRGPDDEA
jgi:hypothetical protein